MLVFSFYSSCIDFTNFNIDNDTVKVKTKLSAICIGSASISVKCIYIPNAILCHVYFHFFVNGIIGYQLISFINCYLVNNQG